MKTIFASRNFRNPLLVLFSLVSLAGGALFDSAEAAGKSKSARWHPGNYIFCPGMDPSDDEVDRLLHASPKLRGVQVMYTWRSCEPTKNNYNFSTIKRHLRLAKLANKHLFVQVQFKGFGPDPYQTCPSYLVNGSPKPGGGFYSAFSAVQRKGRIIRQPVTWDPVVQARLVSLYTALGTALNSDSNVSALEGVNLPETASPTLEDLAGTPNNVMPKNNDVYNSNIVDRLKALNASLPHTQVLQFINFINQSPSFPDRERSMIQKAIAEGVGMGGPDLRPWDEALERHSYSNTPMAAGKIPIGYAVQYMDTKHPVGGGGFANDTIANVRATYDLAKDLKLNYVWWYGTDGYLAMVKEVVSGTDPAGGLVKTYPNSITPYLE